MRLSTACDECKSRKVRCDGTKPCNHCRRRKNENCYYGPAVKRARLGSTGADQVRILQQRDQNAARQSSSPRNIQNASPARSRRPESQVDDDETMVPRDSGLLQDSHGTLMFVGDVAPMSHLQSVRHFLTALAGSDGFPPGLSCDSLLEQTNPVTGNDTSFSWPIASSTVDAAVHAFSDATHGVLDIGGPNQLGQQIKHWMSDHPVAQNVGSAANYLILAIGLQHSDEQLANTYYCKARDITMARLTFDTNPLTVQSLLLIAIYMLRGCQPNGSYIYFGLACRVSYSIGMHRTEVNARYGKDVQAQRERLYKSLKVTDLLISIGLGRPPALYDLDCTVPYKMPFNDSTGDISALDDICQVLIIMENIIIEVYGGQRKVSLQLTRQFSQRLKEWADERMPRLNAMVKGPREAHRSWTVIGACHALATYYFSVMLLARPFLMYEAYQMLRRKENSASGNAAARGRRTLAEGCVDAACCLVELVLGLTRDNRLPQKLPVLTSWVFTASLTLGVALASGFGRIMERYIRNGIEALEFFSKQDAQAMQYLLIIKALLATCVGHIQQRELNDRLARIKASSELFGLQVGSYQHLARNEPSAEEQFQGQIGASTDRLQIETATPLHLNGFATPDWEDFDLGTFGELPDNTNQDIFGTLNMFPMFDNF